MPTQEEWDQMMAKFTLAVVVAAMGQNPDVADTTVGEELFTQLKRHNSAHLNWVTPAHAVTWAGEWAAKVRESTSISVAAALDEDPGAELEGVAGFVHHVWCRTFGAQHEETLVFGFALLLTQHYATQCTRSGLPPHGWAKAFNEAIRAGAWGFSRT